ncbi:MAG: glucuronate isomerase [Sarcina sp.]
MKDLVGENFVIFKAHNILAIGKEGFKDYIYNLGEAIDFKIYDLASLLFAIRLRVLVFRTKNCRIIDKAIEDEFLRECNFEEVDYILKKALLDEEVSILEREKFCSYLMKYLEEVAEELNFII